MTEESPGKKPVNIQLLENKFIQKDAEASSLIIDVIEAHSRIQSGQNPNFTAANISEIELR